MGTERLLEDVEGQRERLTDLATDLWENPEVALEEERAAGRLVDALREEGFDVEEGVADIPTAFVARYGDGDPTVGTIGEYDALPDLSQKRTARREPVEEGAPGHGCGHNLFGVAALGGAVAVKRAIERGDVDGTVVYLGTPAEEGAVGKPFMIRAGAFDDVDAVVSWHPGRYTTPNTGSCLALDSIQFDFTGEASHAGAAPEAGRSALDAVQLANAGVEYMREHVPDAARIHYSIEDAGAAPNVVDPAASVWYYVRAPDRAQVERITDWLRDIAEGAALMTGTSVEANFRGGTYDLLTNDAIAGVIEEQMQEIGPIEFHDEAYEFAADLGETLDDRPGALAGLPEDTCEEVLASDLYADPLPAFDGDHVGSYSTDTGNVSYAVPVGHFTAATWPVGTPAHSWQAVAAGGSSIGTGAAVYAAKVIAASVHELMTDEDRLERAVAEFERETAGSGYEAPLPDDADPFDMVDSSVWVGRGSGTPTSPRTPVRGPPSAR